MTSTKGMAIVRLTVLLPLVWLLGSGLALAQSFHDDFGGSTLDPAWQTWVFRSIRVQRPDRAAE